MKLKLHLNIKDKGRIFFEGEVSAISTYNDIGIFDVLPMHENIISLIKNKIIIHNENEQKELKIESGLLKANNGKVNIYLGI
jgi:F0F1-type ATP synthase epsilon subunit